MDILIMQPDLGFFGKIDNDYEFNNGQKEFSVIEMEVFQIIFDN